MFIEQLQLLFMLYVQPVKAASRIIDTGRFWFALCAVLLALVGVQAGAYKATEIVDPPSARLRALLEERKAVHQNPSAESDDDASPPVAVDRGPVPSQFLMVFGPTATIKVLGAFALAFVPAVILVMTVQRWHESFAVMLRKEYLSVLNCVFFSLTAAYLPVAVVGFVLPPGQSPLLWVALMAAGQIYFLILASICVRTLWGSGMLAAIGASLAGSVGTVVGLIAFSMLGSFGYYLSSPFMLYYAYVLLGSDVRSLGDGFRAKQHMRRQLDFAANNPRDADAQYHLGLIYQQRRQYDEAKRRFARAIEIDPKEADPIFQMGRIAIEEKRFDDAIELLTRAAALDDKCSSHEVWRELGLTYFESSRLEEAHLALAKYVDRRPYDPEGLYWLGKTLVGLGRSSEARQHFESCTEAVETMPSQRRRQLSRWKRMAVAELRSLEKLTPAAR